MVASQLGQYLGNSRPTVGFDLASWASHSASWLGHSRLVVSKEIWSSKINYNNTDLRDKCANSQSSGVLWNHENVNVGLDATKMFASLFPREHVTYLLGRAALLHPTSLTFLHSLNCHQLQTVERHDVLGATVNVFARGTDRPGHGRHPRDRTSHGASSG